MRSKIFSSVRARMVLIYLLVTIAALGATAFIVSYLMEDSLVTQRTKSQLQQTTRLALEITPQIENDNAEALYQQICERAQSMGGRILVLDTDAVVQADSASLQNGTLLPYREVRDVLIGGKEASYGFHHISREHTSGMLGLAENSVWSVYYTAPITVNGEYVGALLFSSLIQDVENSVQEVLKQISIVFLVVAAVVMLTSIFLSGWLTKPILELTGAIRRMGTQGYGQRVKVQGSGEIAELGSAFNRMSERIEAHDKVRDEFIANASHELKTPLATMKLLSESILYDENVNAKVMREFFNDVNHEMDRLSRIVTDLLNLVQSDVTEAGLKLETVRLDELVVRAAERLRPLADNKGLQLIVSVEPTSIQADPLKMEQVIVNLTENAIKYTDKGRVEITVKTEHDEALFITRDTGIGIPEESIGHLFERFYRVDKARSRGTGGTGLGLAIVEKIVSLHGGYIQVESEPQKGSTFTVRLPLGGKDA